MAVLADEKIAGIALNAGFTGNALNTAVAIALAESGGNPRAHNATPPDDSYGLMQINMLGAMGPERRKRFNLRSNEDLYDPSTNMRVAYALWKSRGGFGDWSTYNNGRYLTYLQRANRGVVKNGGKAIGTASVGGDTSGATDLSRPDTPLPDPVENAIYDVRDAIANVSGFVRTITDAQTWLRVALFIGGGLLVAVALLFLVGQSRTVRTAASVVPVGRAVKAAKGVL